MASNLYFSKDSDIWSSSKIIEEIQLCLMKKFEKDSFNRKYLKNTEYLLYRIPIFRPIPYFEIEELASLRKRTLDYVMKEAIGRIFEEINQEYFPLI